MREHHSERGVSLRSKHACGRWLAAIPIQAVATTSKTPRAAAIQQLLTCISSSLKSAWAASSLTVTSSSITSLWAICSSFSSLTASRSVSMALARTAGTQLQCQALCHCRTRGPEGHSCSGFSSRTASCSIRNTMAYALQAQNLRVVGEIMLSQVGNTHAHCWPHVHSMTQHQPPPAALAIYSTHLCALPSDSPHDNFAAGGPGVPSNIDAVPSSKRLTKISTPETCCPNISRLQHAPRASFSSWRRPACLSACCLPARSESRSLSKIKQRSLRASQSSSLQGVVREVRKRVLRGAGQRKSGGLQGHMLYW